MAGTLAVQGAIDHARALDAARRDTVRAQLATAPANQSTWIVEVRPRASITGAATDVTATGARVRFTYTRVLRGFAITGSRAQMQALAASSAVIAIWPDLPVHLSDTQENPPSWGLDRIDQSALPLSNSYSYKSTGSGVTAYVVDSGIRPTQVDFGGRVAAGFDGINDGQGTNDCLGHGTHVAGIIGGATYGVAKAVTLVPVRTFACTGSSSDSIIINGLNWILANHVAGVPAVVNMSLQGSNSPPLDTAVQSVITAGVPVVVAAGNGSSANNYSVGVDACSQSPADVTNAITVASTGTTDVRSTFSNFGTCVHVFAPGENIISDYYSSDTATATMSGTSMATPFVTGAVAQLLSTTPTLTAIQAAQAISANATNGVVGNAGLYSPNKLLFSDPTVAYAGTVTDTNGVAVSGLTVQLVRPSGVVSASTVTSATGSYSLRPTTGTLTLHFGTGALSPATYPTSWTIPDTPLTVTADTTQNLTVPATATETLQFYDPVSGAPLSGISVYATAPMVTPAYSEGAGLPLTTATANIGPITTDAAGRAVLHTFGGTIPTLNADNMATGTLVRTTFTNLVITDAAAFAVANGNPTLHTPEFVATDGTTKDVMGALLAGTTDLVRVPIAEQGKFAQAFGCKIYSPADAIEASNLLGGATTYTDSTGVVRPAPDGVCALYIASAAHM